MTDDDDCLPSTPLTLTLRTVDAVDAVLDCSFTVCAASLASVDVVIVDVDVRTPDDAADRDVRVDVEAVSCCELAADTLPAVDG